LEETQQREYPNLGRLALDIVTVDTCDVC
jgi:hypothetical protein